MCEDQLNWMICLKIRNKTFKNIKFLIIFNSKADDNESLISMFSFEDS